MLNRLHRPRNASASMIESTFVLLKGIGESTERRLWENGVEDWRTFLARDTIPGISSSRKQAYDRDLASAMRHLEEGRSQHFSRCLKPRDHWRLFETFRSTAVFLDIETTGAPPAEGDVTVVGLYAKGQMTSLVQGSSLSEDRLRQELSQYDLVVTFFGSIFDLPYLRAKFPGLVFDRPHFDLCFAARRLGFGGGLKRIESELSIHRPADLQGLDGWEAVRLWNRWRQGQADALTLLLRYNEADTRNLEPLAEILYSRLRAHYRSVNEAP